MGGPTLRPIVPSRPKTIPTLAERYVVHLGGENKVWLGWAFFKKRESWASLFQKKKRWVGHVINQKSEFWARQTIAPHNPIDTNATKKVMLVWSEMSV